MMRLLLAVLLSMVATSASAAWTELSGNDEFIQYVDFMTLRRNGNMVKIWELKDFKKEQTVDGESYLSTKSQQEYDCKDERVRILAFTLFSGQMGNGSVVYSDGNTEDKGGPVQPDSVGETKWKIACGRK